MDWSGVVDLIDEQGDVVCRAEAKLRGDRDSWSGARKWLGTLVTLPETIGDVELTEEMTVRLPDGREGRVVISASEKTPDGRTAVLVAGVGPAPF